MLLHKNVQFIVKNNIYLRSGPPSQGAGRSETPIFTAFEP